MDKLEQDLVDTVVRMAEVRRLRQRQLLELQKAKDEGRDITKAQRAVDESKKLLSGLQLQRREMAAALLLSRR
jgi:hypothetical protein